MPGPIVILGLVGWSTGPGLGQFLEGFPFSIFNVWIEFYVIENVFRIGGIALSDKP